MKKIKLVLLVVGIIIISTNSVCHAQQHGTTVIGTYIDKEYRVTIDQRLAKEKWEKVLEKSGIHMVFTKFEIVDYNDGNYSIIGTNEDRSITSCIGLILDHDNFYELLTSQGGGLSVSCKGCALGCHPEIKNGIGYCLPLCTPCEKTETVTQEGGGILR